MNTRTILLYSGAASVLCLGSIGGLSANVDQEGVALQAPAPIQLAQAEPSAPRPQDRAMTQAPSQAPDVGPANETATTLLDQQVENHLGQPLGTIEDFIIDARTGRIEFVAIGPEEPFHVVPPHAIQRDLEDNQLVLTITEDQWEGAPTINRGELDQLAEQREAQSVYRFYGVDYMNPEAPAATAGDGPTFGSPPRRPQSPRYQARGLPGDPVRRPSEPRVLPPDNPAIQPGLGWQREYREETIPEGEDGTEFRGRDPDERMEADESEFEEPAPTLRNPRFHGTHRGSGRTPYRPHGPGTTEAEEFGAPGDRRDVAWRTVELPYEERLRWASELMEQRVTDLEDESVGQISDFIVDLQTGQVQHAIVWNESQQEQYAIPVTAIQVDQQDRVTVRPTVEDLQRAPRYDARQARVRPQQYFRYDRAAEPEFGAPERREPEMQN